MAYSPIINIPGTTILIKKEDLVSTHISAKIVRSQRILPPDSSEDEFRLEEVKSIVIGLNADYHSVALIPKTEDDSEDPSSDLRDELKKATVSLETVLFDETSFLLTDSPDYSELDDEARKKVDSWANFYKKHLRFVEKLSDLQIELANAERESEAAAEEMEDVTVSKSSNKELKSKIKLLHENIADDFEKQAERLPKIAKRVISEPEFVVNKFDNAYDVAQHMLDNGIIPSDVYRTFIQGIAKWVEYVRNAFDTTGPIIPVHGLQFIVPNDFVENETEETSDDWDSEEKSESEEEQMARLEREIAEEERAKALALAEAEAAEEDHGRALIKGSPGKIPDNHKSGDRIPM